MGGHLTPLKPWWSRDAATRSGDAERFGSGADTGSGGDAHHSTASGFQGRSETTDDLVPKRVPLTIW